jgi:hypothetical protein
MGTMFGGSDDFAAISAVMQSAALDCISTLQANVDVDRPL